MRVFLSVCLVAVFISAGGGQTEPDVRLCEGKQDFDLCDGDWECDPTVSKCFCQSQTPYCRCNSGRGEFYLGEVCDQRWTVVSFALVAALPAVTLAVIVGVIIHIIHTCTKPTTRVDSKVRSSSLSDETEFPGVVFASDVNTRPKAPPSALNQPQAGVTMATASTHPYSISDSADRPQTGDPRPLYSSAAGIRPHVQQMGASRLPSSDYDNLPSSPRNTSFNRPSPAYQQPYSYTASPGHVISNPYVKSRNQFDDLSPPADQYRNYTPPSSPQIYNYRRSAPDSRHPAAALPRAQINHMY